jgi:DNA-binding NtrC family response regulator
MARILIIDDDTSMRSVLRRTLDRAGYQTTEASDVHGAIQLLATATFDAVVTDLLMPENDGIELIIHLRKENPRMPVLAISGGGRVSAEDYLEMARTLGATRVLAKPFEHDVFLATIREILATGGAKAP